MISAKTTDKFSLIYTRTADFSFVFLAFQIIALWSVWRWLFVRFASSGEEIWGIAALVAVVFFAFFGQRKNNGEITTFAYFSAAFFLFLYAVSFAFAPPLMRGILAIISLTFVLSDWRFARKFHIGIFVLLLLGLPIVASLNFYLGFPLRVVVGEAVAFLLQMQGLSVFREGVCLHFGDKSIWIDAPCSGIKMLWFGIFLTAAAACFYELKNSKILAALALSFVIILLGNIFRASALFYTEAEIVKVPQWFHETAGVFSFGLTALAIVFITKKIAEFEWQKYFSS